MQCRELFREIEGLEQEFLQVWVDVTKIESPTKDKAGVDAVGNYLIQKAKEYGFSVEIARQEVSGDAICITMNGDRKERPICFSGHIDTVHEIGSFPSPVVHCDEEWIYGPGVADCKGGVVASFLAMAALQKVGFRRRPVKLILQSDEENSSVTSNKATVRFMCEQARDAIAFLNTESGDGKAATIQRKGIVRYIFDVKGKAAHSAICYNGVSAICEAAHKIIELEKMKDRDGITCNCGVISGGTVANTVPERCTFLADIRFATKEQFEWAERKVKEVADTSYLGDTTCVLSVKSYRCAMEYTERNRRLLEQMNGIYQANGLPVLRENFGNGGSDAADVTAFGVPCLDSLGVFPQKIHSLEERARLSSLVESAKRLASVAFCLEEE